MGKGTTDHQGPASDPADEAVLESLMKHASARPAPSEADHRAVREAVHREWLQLTARRSRWRLTGGLAAAAVVTLVVSLVFRSAGTEAPVSGLIEIAQVERTSGEVSVHARPSGDGRVLAMGMAVYAGQALQTGDNSGVALRLAHGLSLRVDRRSRVNFTAADAVELESGRIYIDSGTAGAAAPTGDQPRLSVITRRGTVHHTGTQYMVTVGPRQLGVSVRQGRVQLLRAEGSGSTLLVASGQKLSVREDHEPEISHADGHGEEWQWAERLGPGFVLDGRTLADFLDWVAGESGLRLSYASDGARAVAAETVMHGRVDLPAREALEVVLMTTDLRSEIKEGVILITESK